MVFTNWCIPLFFFISSYLYWVFFPCVHHLLVLKHFNIIHDFFTFTFFIFMCYRVHCIWCTVQCVLTDTYHCVDFFTMRHITTSSSPKYFLLLPQLLTVIDLFSVSVNLPFLEYHINGIIQYVAIKLFSILNFFLIFKLYFSCDIIFILCSPSCLCQSGLHF